MCAGQRPGPTWADRLRVRADPLSCALPAPARHATIGAFGTVRGHARRPAQRGGRPPRGPDMGDKKLTVGDWMTPNPITIEENASVIEAIHMLKEKGIRRLPVMR